MYDLSGFGFKTLVGLRVVRILWLFVAQVGLRCYYKG